MYNKASSVIPSRIHHALLEGSQTEGSSNRHHKSNLQHERVTYNYHLIETRVYHCPGHVSNVYPSYNLRNPKPEPYILKTSLPQFF